MVRPLLSGVPPCRVVPAGAERPETLDESEGGAVDAILDITVSARRRVALVVVAARAAIRCWVERNLVAEFPADEDLP